MTSPPRPPLALTGERTLPGIPDERYWFERHLVAYNLAGRDVAGERVLDAGCGEGYGLAHLVEAGAAAVIGVDLEPAVIDHIEATYAADPRIEVLQADLGALPLEDGSVDRVVSFQVIEHVHDVPAYLAELRRVTSPGGQVHIATPNRLTFTPGSDTPVNPFHVREFTADELADELRSAGLEVDAVLGVHHGRRLRALERLARRPLTDVLTAGEPPSWPRWIRAAVHRVRHTWFEVRRDDPETSLDLIAVARPAP
ncbi:MAG: class I SAM-dependent methyltransferase [Actinobacteria bacterium]|nr:class I SAM-dependent methyltransferase [Actinomycetota bacterium]